MHRTFRPKGSSVKADQLTKETADSIASWCTGKKTVTENDKVEVLVPTWDGLVPLKETQYIVRTTDRGFRIMDAEEFETYYEPVKTTRSDS